MAPFTAQLAWGSFLLHLTAFPAAHHNLWTRADLGHKGQMAAVLDISRIEKELQQINQQRSEVSLAPSPCPHVLLLCCCCC